MKTFSRTSVIFLLGLGLLRASNNGSIVGSPTFAAAKFTDGLTSTSDSNYVSLPSGLFSTGSSFTIEAQLKNTVSSATQVAIASGQNTNNIWMGIRNGRFYASVNGSGAFASGAAIDSTISIDDGSWHHCRMVMSGGTTMYLFVDGTLGATATGTMNAVSVTSGTLGRFGGTGYGWGGEIDEVAFWNSAISTSSFTPPSSPYTGTEGMVSVYHLEGNASDSAATGTVVYPNSSAIIYSPFNWVVSGSSANTINSGAYFRTLFSGTSASLMTDTSADAAPYSELWARVDGGPWGELILSAGNPTLSLASGLASRNHLLEVIVKSTSETLARWSSSQTVVSITGLLLDTGASLSQPNRRTKSILIFGDSITEGVRTKNSTASNDTDRNDVLGDYSYAISTACDCEVGIVGFGATGVNTSGSGSVPALTSSYAYVYSGAARSFTTPTVDLVIYNEGTNDSGSITAGLETVVNAILAIAPASQHLILTPFNGTHSSDIAAAVSAIGSSATQGNTSGFFNSADSSDGVHPYDYSHLSLIAPQLFPLIAPLL